jgi:hypothetical protein
LGDQSFKALLGAGITTGIKLVHLECRNQTFDLNPGGADFGIVAAADQFWAYDTDQQTKNEHHHQQFDQCKTMIPRCAFGFHEACHPPLARIKGEGTGPLRLSTIISFFRMRILRVLGGTFNHLAF